MIELRQITAGYHDQTIIQDLSFTFETNHTYAIIGPSGCGKTTLLYSIARLLPLLKGQLLISSEIKSSLMFQYLGLFPWKTVE